MLYRRLWDIAAGCYPAVYWWSWRVCGAVWAGGYRFAGRDWFLDVRPHHSLGFSTDQVCDAEECAVSSRGRGSEERASDSRRLTGHPGEQPD